ncbi:MAG: type transport system permease protein [Pseudonocardiales bacterium]|jgi:ABC-2 type transport system permease protein|nr:type transport system permease protein [Pseudonocardiales bacterium]MDQ1752842.1 type transport system permease protein [Pseudonocardiales bacterium]
MRISPAGKDNSGSARSLPSEHEPVAATRRGVHARLAALQKLEPAGSPESTASGYRGFESGRTLPLRVEFIRQLKRRRTQWTGGFLLALPIIMALAFQLGGSSGSSSGGPALVDLATAGAGNFALFTEFASVGFLLVVIVAMFCGDTIASEASWSSLRYLLSLPVPRARLLRQKLGVALTFSFGVNLLLPGWAYLVGGVFFGWSPARSPFGGSFSYLETLQRMLIVAGYAAVQALLVAALAFLLSVLTDAPLAAVGGATFLVVVSNILDSITALDPYRVVLPTHFQYSWLDALTPVISWDDMIRGTALAVIYAAVFFTIAWTRFARKDITS